MTEYLHSASEVAKLIGVPRRWVIEHSHGSGPPPDFTAHRGARPMMLWTDESVNRWRAYYMSETSTSGLRRFDSYSDHNAVNQVGSLTITWKLWWRNTHDGGAMWWFSTPKGWFVSNDDGRSWDFADVMVRPGDYRYISVNGSVNPSQHTLSIIRGVGHLRGLIEKGDDRWLTTKFVPGSPSTNSQTA